MTTNEIINMAIQSGIVPWTKHEWVGVGTKFSASDEGLDGDLTCLIQFASMVAAAERSACIKALEENEQFYCRDTLKSMGAA